MSKQIIIGTVLFLGFLHQIISAQSIDLEKRAAFSEIKTVFQQLQGYQKFVLKTNLDSLVLNRYTSSSQEAFLLAIGKNQPVLEVAIKIEARGVLRRKICDIPPIKLNFSKTDLQKQGIYRGYDKLKIVTYCQLAKGIATEQALLKEYWIYKMYQELTPNSFKVHLVDIVYVHSEDPSRKIKSYAFIIENAEELAHRLNGTIVKGYGKTPLDFNQAAYLQTLLFNYMIGNTDWGIEKQKNVKFLQKMDREQLIVVPYDFDFSALTKPPYWVLVDIKGEQPGIKNRVLLGTITNESLLKHTIAHFLTLSKTGFLNFEKSELLRKKTKKEMHLYLQSFFRLLKNKKRVTKVFLKD